MSDPLGIGVSGQWGARHHPSSQVNRQTPPPAGFRFEIGTAPIDWVKIARAPLNTIQRRGDAQSLSTFLGDVALGDLKGVDCAHPALLKSWKLAQLSSQYLLHTQTLLESQLNLMSADLSGLDRMAEKENQRVKSREVKIQELKKEERSQKRLINTYHRMLRQHNPALAKRVVQHGDGRISLIEKGNEYEGGKGVTKYEDGGADDFYTEFNTEEKEKKEQKEKEKEKKSEKMTYDDVFGVGLSVYSQFIKKTPSAITKQILEDPAIIQLPPGCEEIVSDVMSKAASKKSGEVESGEWERLELEIRRRVGAKKERDLETKLQDLEFDQEPAVLGTPTKSPGGGAQSPEGKKVRRCEERKDFSSVFSNSLTTIFFARSFGRAWTECTLARKRRRCSRGCTSGRARYSKR